MTTEHQRRTNPLPPMLKWTLIGLCSTFCAALGMIGFLMVSWTVIQEELNSINEFSGMIIVGMLMYSVMAGVAVGAICFAGLSVLFHWRRIWAARDGTKNRPPLPSA